ncbi:MAG: DUF2851 family protein, partial [Candidatus Poribacteria bacterium]|nr:DUF2851 family protein [Candidatus Poribacteria bacterium]
MTDLKNIDEHFVQTVWNDQRFFAFDLQSTDGRPIQVLKPGIWNSDTGPDFVQAEILIDGKLHTGDVEVHVRSSEWYDHKHHLNPRYNRVILHTVFWNDDINLRTRLQNGKRTPTLELLDRLDAPISDLFDERQEAQAASIDGCHVTGKSLNIQRLQSVFDKLGEERLLEKADAMRSLLVGLDFEQLLYAGIMDALGYARNRKPFRELAQRVPLSQLMGKPDEDIQAILFGAAGLLPSQAQQPIDLGEADKAFIERLETLWEAAEQRKNPTRMTAEQWHFARMRPANYPTRRIPAISQLISHCQDGLMMTFLPLIEEAATVNQRGLARIRRQLLDTLTPAPSGYWIEHCHFGKGIPQHGAALIGRARAADIIVNILLPIALVWAEHSQSPKLAEAVQRLYASHPKLQENHITRQIEVQIFSEAQPIKLIAPSAKKQQGAIYLHRNFCSSRLCDLCPIIQGGGV